jgi:hypothetical protein
MPRGAETITIQHFGPPDDFGDRPLDGDPVVVGGCSIWPRTSTENADKGVVVISGLNVFVPPGNEIRPTDQITARGETYDVEGEPGLYVRGTRAVGSIVVLKRVGS